MNEKNNNQELEINRKNREDYENLMKNSSTQLDGYWDSNSFFVRFILAALGLIIICGVAYYVLTYFGKI